MLDFCDKWNVVIRFLIVNAAGNGYHLSSKKLWKRVETYLSLLSPRHYHRKKSIDSVSMEICVIPVLQGQVLHIDHPGNMFSFKNDSRIIISHMDGGKLLKSTSLMIYLHLSDEYDVAFPIWIQSRTDIMNLMYNDEFITELIDTYLLDVSEAIYKIKKRSNSKLRYKFADWILNVLDYFIF